MQDIRSNPGKAVPQDYEAKLQHYAKELRDWYAKDVGPSAPSVVRISKIVQNVTTSATFLKYLHDLCIPDQQQSRGAILSVLAVSYGSLLALQVLDRQLARRTPPKTELHKVPLPQPPGTAVSSNWFSSGPSKAVPDRKK